MSFWKKEKDAAPPVSEAAVDSQEVGTAADVDEVMKKFDRESNVRVWEGEGPDRSHQIKSFSSHRTAVEFAPPQSVAYRSPSQSRRKESGT